MPVKMSSRMRVDQDPRSCCKAEEDKFRGFEVVCLVDDSHGGSDSGNEEAGLENNSSSTSGRLALNRASGGTDDHLGRSLLWGRRGELDGGGLDRDRSLGRRGVNRRRVDNAGSGAGGVDGRRNNDRGRRGNLGSGLGSLVGAVGNLGAALGDGHVVGGGGGEGGGELLLGGDESSGRNGENGGETHLEFGGL